MEIYCACFSWPWALRHENKTKKNVITWLSSVSKYTTSFSEFSDDEDSVSHRSTPSIDWESKEKTPEKNVQTRRTTLMWKSQNTPRLARKKKRYEEGTSSLQNRLEESNLLLILTCISIRHFGCLIPLSNSFAFMLFWIWRDWMNSPFETAAVPSSRNYFSEFILVRNDSSAAFETGFTVEIE